MKKIINIILSGTIIGICIGFLIALTFSLIGQTSHFVPSAPTFVNHFSTNTMATAVSAILWSCTGILFRSASLIFTVDKWSITHQTILHFVITFIIFTPLAVLAGWFPLNISALITFTIIFVVTYIILWSNFMHKAQQEVKELNSLLKNR
ncbi:DUF3021 domain-containing protein [Weissella sagaensis]|uniref:DUF3021 domain-containing protein n=1 Tax=Weissella sagaensis TaxID=2559928 RepID=UPI0011BB392B|nr:DUF3021 domain-containing protein [Weissella sagaensis]QEA57857.1 DUF3021 domain-containing protein [Weissella hellenica]